MLATQKYKTFNSSASTSSPEALRNLSLTSSLEEGTSLPDLEPTASILRLTLRFLTPPIPVTPTPSPLVLTQLAPTTPPTLYPVPDSIHFDPRIKEALPYTAMVQAAYPPPATTPRDYLEATAKATSRELHPVLSLPALLSSK